MKNIIIAILSSLLLVACSSMKVKNIEGVEVPPTVSVKQMAKAIKDAAENRNWKVVKHSKGVYTLKVDSSGRSLTVKVPYKKGTYSVNYESSENLKYDEATGKIHKKAYKWMRVLSRDIKRAIAKQ